MSFVKLSIFGTSFEVRYKLQTVRVVNGSHIELPRRSLLDMVIFNQWGWVSLNPLYSPLYGPRCSPMNFYLGAFGLVWYVGSFSVVNHHSGPVGC